MGRQPSSVLENFLPLQPPLRRREGEERFISELGAPFAHVNPDPYLLPFNTVSLPLPKVPWLDGRCKVTLSMSPTHCRQTGHLVSTRQAPLGLHLTDELGTSVFQAASLRHGEK